jgi:hypothetical protein
MCGREPVLVRELTARSASAAAPTSTSRRARGSSGRLALPGRPYGACRAETSAPRNDGKFSPVTIMKARFAGAFSCSRLVAVRSGGLLIPRSKVRILHSPQRKAPAAGGFLVAGRGGERVGGNAGGNARRIRVCRRPQTPAWLSRSGAETIRDPTQIAAPVLKI